MALQTAIRLASFFAFGVSASAFAVLIAARLWPARARPVPAAVNRDAVFLLRGDRLVDATAGARALLARAPGVSDRDRLLAALAPRFPMLEASLADLPARRHIDLAAEDGHARIEADWQDGQARLRLVRAADPDDLPALDGHALSALLAELDGLRAVAEAAPVPLWRMARSGEVFWANGAYLSLSAQAGAPLSEAMGLALADATSEGRAALALQGAKDEVPFGWKTAERAGELVCAAWPERRALAGEASLDGFLGTLADTFAHLAVGLAVFDDSRRLALFNPAFSDLTGVPGGFLAARPSLDALLDRLREDRMSPEPRDYRAWRNTLSALESAGDDGLHTELWPLADGRTFRITVRPQAAGALAFLVEDVSGVLAISRRYRSELELSQGVLDGLDEAIAVFTSEGILTLANDAYCALWGHDPLARLGGTLTLADAVSRWQARCIPTPHWGDAGAFAAGLALEGTWRGEVRLRDGRRIACHFRQIAGRALLAGFLETGAATARPVPAPSDALSA